MTLVESIIGGLIVAIGGAIFVNLNARIKGKVDKDVCSTNCANFEKEFSKGEDKFASIDKKQDRLLESIHNLDTTTQVMNERLELALARLNENSKKGGR